MDAYFQPVACTYSEAAMDSNLTWNNECNFVPSFNITPNTYLFSPYQYSQIYPSDTSYLFDQIEPIASLPDQNFLNKPSQYASDRRDSCHNLTDAWTTSNVTNTGCSADAAVTQPITTTTTTTTTTTMQGIVPRMIKVSRAMIIRHTYLTTSVRLHRKLVQYQRQVEHATIMAATDEFSPPVAIFSVTNENVHQMHDNQHVPCAAQPSIEFGREITTSSQQDVKDLGIVINAFGYKETTCEKG
ncbi:hypothetical protein KCU71_g3747, partial [Aureobasidium melanogenum]